MEPSCLPSWLGWPVVPPCLRALPSPACGALNAVAAGREKRGPIYPSKDH